MKVKLFCIPHAGGSATVFNQWKRYLNPNIELCPIELSGRGARFGTGLYNTMEEAVEDVFSEIKKHSENIPYAILGHSMGSIITYEIYNRIQSIGYKLPVHIFISGRKAPHVENTKSMIHDLPDKEFIKEILDMGGTPLKVFQDKELMDIFLPIIRADYKIVEEYKYNKIQGKILCPMTIFNGKEDKIDIEHIEKWREYAGNGIDIINFEGGHFFIYEKIKEITKIINDKLM